MALFSLTESMRKDPDKYWPLIYCNNNDNSLSSSSSTIGDSSSSSSQQHCYPIYMNGEQKVGTNISSNVTNPLDLQSGPKGVNYKEQIQWRDAPTGKLLAASDFFSQMSAGFEVSPGYGGLIYEGLNDGHIMVLKVLPTSSSAQSPQPSNSTSSTNANSTSSTPASTSASGG